MTVVLFVTLDNNKALQYNVTNVSDISDRRKRETRKIYETLFGVRADVLGGSSRRASVLI